MLEIKVYKVSGSLDETGTLKEVQCFITDGFAEQWCGDGEQVQIGSEGKWYVTSLSKGSVSKIKERVSVEKDKFSTMLDILAVTDRCVFGYKWLEDARVAR